MAELKITKDNFEQEVLKATKPVLLDFWAEWCGPCRMLAPVIAEIAEEKAEEILVGKINVDEESDLASAFRVSGIPTVVLIKNGKAVNFSVGFKSKEALLAMLDA